MNTLRQRLDLSPAKGNLLAGLVLAGIYLYFFVFKAHIDLYLKMHAPTKAWLKVYWAEAGEPYSEANMQRILINGVHQWYKARIGNLHNVERIRIDPVEFETRFELRSVDINQPGLKTISFNPENGFAGLNPVNHINDLEYSDTALTFETVGHDGQFEYFVQRDTTWSFPTEQIFIVIGIILLTLLVGRTLGHTQKNLAFIPVLLLLAVMLAFAMAMLSKHYYLHPNGVARIFVHPDEEVHAVASEYYRDHWLPPRLDSEEVQYSFSVYGYTRLASYELYYPVSGYLSRLLKPFGQAFMTDLRIVGVVMFLLMALLAFRYEAFRPFAVPLLITPQLWYLFSYANSDGFAVIVSIWIAYQAAHKESTLNRMLTESAPKHLWFHLGWLGLLVGTLFLLKSNFYFFILFLGLYLIWRLVLGDFPEQKRLWTRLSAIAIVGLSLVGLRVGLDYAANGPDPGALKQRMIEAKADPLYKPSTELRRKHAYLYMRDRGVSLHRMLTHDKWLGKTFVSAFGAYGYTQYLGTHEYYDLVTAIGVAMAGVIILSVLLGAPASVYWLCGITAFCAMGLIAASLWNSWTVSFQAQGRYLAPILPMLGVLYTHIRPWLMQRVFSALLVALFLVGVYSFVFIGLADIPKIP